MTEETIGEGKASISATLDFKPMSSALTRTRAAGDVLNEISSLHVLLYDYDTKSLINRWKIEGYSVSDEKRDDENAENGHSAETSTKRATFKLPERIDFGKYYMYAVANIPDLLTAPVYSEAIKTVEGLKNIPLVWDSENVAANGQMIGCLMTRATTLPIDNEPLVLNENSPKLHAWLRRAASKVTVAFDGSGLADGVSIYFKALRIKSIPVSCKLGTENTVESNENLIPTGEEVVYSESANFDTNYPALITKNQPYYPRELKQGEDGTVSWVMAADAHSETNPNSLFFYENMQGEGPDKSAAADENKDGLLDTPYVKGKECGTYIEVDAYYESTNPQRPGISNITYRFMLGQNVSTDYNAKRNCHYKLTLHFRGFADEPDWRIDYVTKFGVSQPYNVNYQGKYFLPDNVTDNQGNNFYENNTIKVSSYRYDTEDVWGKRELLDYTIEYKDSVDEDFPNGEFSKKVPAWLSGELEDVTDQYPNDKAQGLRILKINYKNDYKEVNINSLLKSRTNTGITDLAANGTANCYIVDAKGTYTLPLVYGNAVGKDGNIVSSSYTGFSGDDRVLQTFRNYKNEDIKSPYILDDVGRTGITVGIVWQDSENLISSISYETSVYGGKGGLKFSIGDNIAQGNAVIAVKKDGVIIWSWHIWVTSKELTDRIWTIKNYWFNKRYDVMPVNLGWCSLPEENVRYYDRHKCHVRFRQILSRNADGTPNYGSEQIVTILQEPHIALPRGNNTYYQWGRKDPLVGTDASWANKPWWCTNGTSLVYRTTQPDFLNPSLFKTIKENGKDKIIDNPEGINPNDRLTSKESLHRMIQNPHKLNNPRRIDFYIGDKQTDTNGNEILVNGKEGFINDEIHSNLWLDDKKTVYDPCPPGYKVAPLSAFTAFTVTDGATKDSHLHGYNVSKDNMLAEYRDGNMEFYVDGKRKLISVTFPLSGYRDYDAGEVYYVGKHLYVWQAHNYINGDLYYANNNSNFFKAHWENNGYIGVNIWEFFFATDACSVRPIKE
ncbi:DUF4906 domain-containing protein [Xylanibacter muris]|uniref:DUF4906 domain-containing protein n=1 Tax=Xylanibacter muris TaxID=2736290 RepID=A0ABX2ARM3_9BACT|nr:DUF4906 domain-containing protein [Xylanibacter muris]NPD92892.1 DUF4906 domain-containing protein [Xylanibacter muris]